MGIVVTGVNNRVTTIIEALGFNTWCFYFYNFNK